MTYSELLQAAAHTPQAVIIPASWGQGRTVFGGLGAALVYQAMQAQVPAGRPARALSVSFIGPLQVEAPVAFQVEVLRQGKSVIQVQGRAIQDGEVKVLVQASFGVARESTVPALRPVDSCGPAPFRPGRMPEFTRYLAIRWGEGSPPFSHKPVPAIGGWVRFAEGEVSEPLGVADFLVLVDAWPPVTLSHLAAPAPNSSLTWTIEFVQPLPVVKPDDWCLYRAHIEHAQDGYGHIAAGLWDAQGGLIAMSRQTVTIYG
jgi:acyl-CoA thioesterase